MAAWDEENIAKTSMIKCIQVSPEEAKSQPKLNSKIK